MNYHKIIPAMMILILALPTVTIEEGFESGTMPPPGWTLYRTNGNETWQVFTFNPMDGLYFASVFYDEKLSPQDEILFSPEFRPAAGSGRVKFWSKGSLHWCRDVHDNCDLEVWFVNWSWGGGDDVRLGLADDDWTGPVDYIWSHSSFDFGNHAAGRPARIAFRYVGRDGAQVGLDEVTISYRDAGGQDRRISLPIISMNFDPCRTAKSHKEYQE